MRHPLLAAIGLLAALGGCARPEEAPTPKPVAEVTTVAAVTGEMDETVAAYGQAEFDPADIVTLTAPVEAQVATLYVAVGEGVRPGQAVAALKASPGTELELARSVREAETAQAEYARLVRLRTDGLAADNEVNAARAAAQNTSEVARSLKARIGGGSTVLRADRAGVVDALPAAPGDLAAAGAPVVRIGGLGRLRARLGLEPEDAGRVRSGQPVRIEAMHAGGHALAARIQSVDERVDPNTRLAGVLALLPGRDGFLPGEALKGEIVVERRTGVTVVPRQALLYAGEQPYVFLAVGGKAVRREVRIGLEDTDRVEIVEGVQPAQRVVVEGGAVLQDGMALREQAPKS